VKIRLTTVVLLILILSFLPSCAGTVKNSGSRNKKPPIHNGMGLKDSKSPTVNKHKSRQFTADGHTHLKNGEYEEARKSYTRAIELDEKNALAFVGRGRSQYELENYKKGLEDYRRAVELAPGDAMKYVNRGDVYLAMEKYDLAMRDYEKALKLDPKSGIAFYGRATIEVKRGNYNEALKDLDQAIKFGGDMKTSCLLMGFINFKLKNYEDSIRDYEKVLQMEPASDVALLGIARNLAAKKEASRALKFLDKVDKIRRMTEDKDTRKIRTGQYIKPEEVAQTRAFAYFELDDYDNAIKYCNKYLEKGGKSLEIYEILGLSHFLKGDDKKAADAFKRWLKSNPDPKDAEGYHDLGWACLLTGNTARALECFNKSVELDPESFVPYLGRGKIYFERGDYKRAKADLEKSLSLKPDTVREKELNISLLKEIEKKEKR